MLNPIEKAGYKQGDITNVMLSLLKKVIGLEYWTKNITNVLKDSKKEKATGGYKNAKAVLNIYIRYM